MNIVAIGSILLILYIVYSLVVPTKAMRAKLREETKPRVKPEVKSNYIVYDQVGIYSATYERGLISGYITNLKPTVLQFGDIAKGDYSQTLYVTVDVNGGIKVNDLETDAQKNFNLGDYGITAITMSHGRIHCQAITPNGTDPKNVVSIRFNLVIGS